jgi:hypothetical protein
MLWKQTSTIKSENLESLSILIADLYIRVEILSRYKKQAISSVLSVSHYVCFIGALARKQSVIAIVHPLAITLQAFPTPPFLQILSFPPISTT